MVWPNHDEETWLAFAKFNAAFSILFVTAFGLATALAPQETLLIIENGVLAGLFAFMERYCSYSA